MQKPKNGKPVSDQWVPAFVIIDDKDKPVGTIQVLRSAQDTNILVLMKLHTCCPSPWRAFEQHLDSQSAAKLIALMLHHSSREDRQDDGSPHFMSLTDWNLDAAGSRSNC